MTPCRFASILAVGLALSGCGNAPNGSTVFGVGPGGPGSSTGKAGKGSGSGGEPRLDLGGSSGGSTGLTGSDCGPNLTGLVRDFKAKGEPGGHPDFEAYAGTDASPGIVEDLLGKDKKPVYKPDGPLISMYGQQTTSKKDFDEWYRDTDDVNLSAQFLVPLAPLGNGISSYDNGAFFPIDDQLFGNYAMTGHNFHFTFELHTTFVYQGGEKFTFIGDDDLWVFVNGHLGIDLGGLHQAQERTILLDDVATQFKLQKATTYPLDLFHAERHTTASHFRIDTSIEFTNCDAIIIPR